MILVQDIRKNPVTIVTKSLIVLRHVFWWCCDMLLLCATVYMSCNEAVLFNVGLHWKSKQTVTSADNNNAAYYAGCFYSIQLRSISPAAWPRGGSGFNCSLCHRRAAWRLRVQPQPVSPPCCPEAPGSTAAWVTAVLPGGSGFIGTAVWTSVW